MTSPSLGELMSNILRDLPQALAHYYDAVTRPAASLAAGARDLLLRRRRNRVARRGFPGLRSRQREIRARFRRSAPGQCRARGDESALRRRAPPTLTRHEGGSPSLAASDLEGFAHQLAAAVGAGSQQRAQAHLPARQPGGSRQSPRISRRTVDARSSSRAITSRPRYTQSPAR